MKAFEYASPASVSEALSLLSGKWGESEVLAGGTDLVTSLKQDLTRPNRVVSLKNVKELAGIRSSGGELQIGATTLLKDLIADAAVREHFPALVTAAQNIASPQLLNGGTVGGEILQRPRCWFYRQGLGLFGTVNGKSVVPGGDNRYHAIFGNKGPAFFVHPSSLAPVLITLDAVVTLQSASGSREVKAADFFATPSDESGREHVMKPNEILAKISVPEKGLRNGLYEVRQRVGLDWPMVAAAVAFQYAGSDRERKAEDARVVLGHVAPTPWTSEKASKALEGMVVQSARLAYFGFNDEGAAKVGAAAAEGASPLSRNGYKLQLVKVAVARAIEAACPTRTKAWTEK